ncbi:hypothetical protein [Salinibacter altiplanensis]|uniref:hypothetical protein n=1 Tax=Salinibacter altiplanensis TaxID=1803181 RepID=UPI00130000C6|nr:hypothetical protein [Salinibacter altiplanensis]
MPSVAAILNADTSDPTLSMGAGAGSPLSSRMNFRRSTPGRTLAPRSGLYKKVGEDQPRIWGPEQALVVEAAATNQVKHSSDISKWTTNDVTITPSAADSVFADRDSNGRVNAAEFTGSNYIKTQGNNAGFFDNTFESFSVILEMTGGAAEMEVRNKSLSGFLKVVSIRFDKNGNSLNQSGDIRKSNVEVLPYEGPNGGRLIRAVATVGGTSQTDNKTTGGERQLRVRPESNTHILHHGQITNTRQLRQPIVTGNSSKQVNKDATNNFDVPVDELQQGTFFFDYFTGVEAVKGRLIGANFSNQIQIHNDNNIIVEIGDGGFSVSSSIFGPLRRARVAVAWDQNSFGASGRTDRGDFTSWSGNSNGFNTKLQLHGSAKQGVGLRLFDLRLYPTKLGPEARNNLIAFT